MIDPKQNSPTSSIKNSSLKDEGEKTDSIQKGPLSFLSGAITSIFFAWLSFLLSKKVVVYFTFHSSTYASPIAQNIASAMKTLAIGMCFLATFTFSFIGIGLAIVFVRSLFTAKNHSSD